MCTHTEQPEYGHPSANYTSLLYVFLTLKSFPVLVMIFLKPSRVLTMPLGVSHILNNRGISNTLNNNNIGRIMLGRFSIPQTTKFSSMPSFHLVLYNWL